MVARRWHQRHELAMGRISGRSLEGRAFRDGLSETGRVEGRDVTIEYRWADDQYDRLSELAVEPIARGRP
jgi:hypothetical protein